MEETLKTHREFFNHERFVNKDSNINNDLELELAVNPANLAYYNAQAVYWNTQADRLKSEYKVRRATVVLDAKRTDSKTPAVTLEALQDADSEAQDLYNQYLLALEQQKLFYGAVDTLSQKQYSLGSLNSREKREQEIGTSAISRSTAEDRAVRRAEILASQG